MKNRINKITKIALILGIFTTLFSANILSVSAQTWFENLQDAAGKLFTTDEQGTDLSDFKPGESLELEEKGLNKALTASTDVREFILKIVNFALGFLGLVAILIIIYAGVLYLTAGGAEENTGKAKKAIMYAVIGLIIIVGSYAIVNTVIKGLGGGTSTDTGKVVGVNYGNSFNASAVQVQSVAKEIYSNFILFAQSAEEIKGIVNDSNKDSLNYSKNLVARQDILNFLSSEKQKVSNIRGRVPQFSAAYVEANTIINKLERQIDSVKIMPERLALYDVNTGTVYEKGEINVYCTYPDPARPSCVTYPQGLYSQWSEIKKEINSPDSDLLRLFEAVKTDYLDRLKNDYMPELYAMKQIFGGFDATKDAGSSVAESFNQMMNDYGYNPANPNTYSTGSFMYKIKNWSVTNSSTAEISEATQLLIKILKAQIAFSDGLQSVKSVEAHLSANTVSGNAPLVVTFNVLDSLDPAGGSIIDKNIDWTNLGGSKTLTGMSVDVSDAVVCTAPIEKEIFGPAYRQCTFKYPGTYSANVTIKSNDPTKYVPGMSSLVIKVNPPTTKIDLQVTIQGKKIPVMSYYENGILKNDKDTVSITLNEAKKGIIFDASKTENVENFKWSFGTGKVSGTSDNTIDNDQTGQQTVVFDSEGKNVIRLDVMSKLGELDSKYFVLDVRNVAARIQVSPNENVFINRPIIIDGTLSSASSGKIKSYEWVITKTSGEIKEIDLGENRNNSSFAHKFTEPGKYKVGLKVTSELETVQAEPYSLTVESQAPKAIYEYLIPDTAQPSTVNFNASKSFDPDGQNPFITYKWSIAPDSKSGEAWMLLNGSTLNDKNPIIKFRKIDDYKVTLRVSDSSTLGSGLKEEYTEITKTISVQNVLDVAWGSSQQTTAVVNAEGKATMNFLLASENAIAYEIKFGDGDSSNGEIKQSKVISHTYAKAGKYDVKATVYDENDNDNSVTKKIFIGGGDLPVAKMTVFVNGIEITDLSDEIKASKGDVITFDASESKNTDGTGRNLKYNWDFGDTFKSSNKSVTHIYKELSPQDPGYFTVQLKIYDKDVVEKEARDEIKMKIANKAPTLSSLEAVPDSSNTDLVTPVKVDLKVYGAEDRDGDISQFRWWYFDVDDPDEPLGMQITQTPETKITIGTNGKEGNEVEYGFGVEITDNDNAKSSSRDVLTEEQTPKLKVKNGPNEAPVAKFKVNATKVFTGDKVVFTSASTDIDGQIVSYIWDFEGDGFFNNPPTKEAVAEHTYSNKNLNGYDVRLKVIDDKSGEGVSTAFKVYVDSLSAPPKAAFKYNVVDGSDGKKVKFTNNSTSDTATGATIIRYSWDFDTTSFLTTADSDGDGKKDNDVDSAAKDPERLYTEQGTYTVKLTVTDSNGASDFVLNTMKIPMANPPKAAFGFSTMDDGIHFKNNSTADSTRGATIEKNIWDFDTMVDSDGDGYRDNDADSSDKEPVHIYTKAGKYSVKLTVKDNQGNSDGVINIVNSLSGSLPNVAGTGTTGTQVGTSIKAVLETTPKESAEGIIYLTGDIGSVTFNFSNSQGNIASYSIDKNIYFDTDGNGIKTDDNDFKTQLPGTWKTNFEKVWGTTVVKLTVTDIYGNINTVTKEIKFK
ncbi:PKD domain-containing protein [Candidatus Gracilibacteria bacterium]|nr:PKD domain-containing protein [Candidatus Gracilibacteria bacterium]